MGRRTLLLVAAVLLAAIGTGALFLYVRSLSVPAAIGGGDGETQMVWAPQADLPAGLAITKDTPLVQVSVSRSAATAAKLVTDRAALNGKVTNRALTALVPMSSTAFGGTVSGKAQLPFTGQMAITVSLDDANRVADFLQPGSRVAVFVIDPADTTRGGQQNQPAQQNRQGHEARLVLADVTVITTGTTSTIVDGNATPAPTGQQGAGSKALVTLAVDQEQAGKLLVAQASGELYLTLLNGDAKATPKSYDGSAIVVP